MKLLLTSGGITNKSLADKLQDMVGKAASETKIIFIPTAANVEKGQKSWLLGDFDNLRKFGFNWIDIVDFSAVPRNVWEPRMKVGNIWVFGGGNTFHLMNMIRKHNIEPFIKAHLETKIYVGISAGSIVCSPTLSSSMSKRLYSEEEGDYKDNRGMSLVDFHIRPHLNSPEFPEVKENDDVSQELTRRIKEKIYVIDDTTGIAIENEESEVISEGTWFSLN